MSRATRYSQTNGGSQSQDRSIRVKIERTASRSQAKRNNVQANSHTQEDDDEAGADENGADSHDDHEDIEENYADSPRSRKRARRNDAEDAADGESGSGESFKGTMPRDPKDNYVSGSIVRVQLKNFVTYDYVEFHPGPYLNMILGPNGTGKSSIACAICLGLNFPPSVLGRADNIPAFVKTGHKDGYIEIELKGPRGERNLVIRRNISSSSKNTTFTLNGKAATGREVNERIARLNIQVSNLCSFLPQDKVSEFARMNPQQLLRETQRAAGEKNLTHWHDTLISSGKEQREIAEKLRADRDQLKTMIERNQLLERDVERFNQRKQIEKDIKLLELAIPFVEYLAAREEYKVAKENQRTKHQRVKRLEALNAPAHAFKEELEDQKKKYEKLRTQKQRSIQDRMKGLKTAFDTNERLRIESDKILDQLDKVRTEDEERRNRIKRLEDVVRRHKEELENPPPIEDAEVIAEEMRSLNHDFEQTRKKIAFFKERQNRNREEVGRAVADIDDATRRLHQLDDVAVQKLDSLSRWDPDAGDTVRWLRNNKERFKMDVIEPAAITLRVKDPRYVDAVEALFSATQLKTFVVQCLEDSKTLNRYINDTTEGLGRKGRITVWYRPRSAVAPQPIPPEQLINLGFDCYAIDQIECPDGLLWYLEKECNIHRAAIALNPRNVDPNVAMEAISDPATGGQGNFILGRIMNQVTRSSYGQRLATNMTRDIPRARTLAGQNVDESAKRALDERIAEARTRKLELEREQRSFTEEEQELRTAENEFKSKNSELRERQQKVSNAKRRALQLANQIRGNETTIKQEKAKPSVEAVKTRMKSQLFEIARKRVEAVRQYTKSLRQAVKEQEEGTRLNLIFLQIGANLTGLETLIQQKAENYSRAIDEFNRADAAYNAIKKVSKAKLEISKEKLAEAEDDIRDMFESMENKLDPASLEDLQRELENLQAQLELQVANNPGVIEQYERRKQEIANLEKTIETAERRESNVLSNIKVAQDKWQPALERLVASIGQKFSAAFDRIGCAGEIKITQAPEYEKWAIDILVKFRDNEKLQLLTAQRQSGGERSLTTILYLMSLTEEARAPFSLVDEINQGMDMRAERAVHDQMVEVTCRPDSCQYFLITPKLLPGLKYHPLMKVLCVNNGEWLPDQKGIGNMMRLIDGYRGHASTSM